MQPNNETDYLKLVEENRARLLRLCRVYAWNAPDQEDLYQEILVQIWRSLPGLREKSYANSWLYRVALNTALTFARKSKAQSRSIPMENSQLQRRSEEQPEDSSGKGSPRVEELHAAMDQLSSMDKALVTLFLEGLSYEEISVVLGVSSNHVGVMLHRVKKKLSSLMKEAP